MSKLPLFIICKSISRTNASVHDMWTHKKGIIIIQIHIYIHIRTYNIFLSLQMNWISGLRQVDDTSVIYLGTEFFFALVYLQSKWNKCIQIPRIETQFPKVLNTYRRTNTLVQFISLIDIRYNTSLTMLTSNIKAFKQLHGFTRSFNFKSDRQCFSENECTYTQGGRYELTAPQLRQIELKSRLNFVQADERMRRATEDA